MSILIDGRPLQTYSATRGIGRYVRQIARIFESEERADFLFFRGDAPPPPPSRRVFTPSPRRMITWTDSLFLPGVFARHGTTCYHSTAYGLPKRSPKTRYIMTVHDLTPMMFPQFFSIRLRSVFRRIIAAAKRADLVITVSQNTTNDLQRFVDIPKERVQTIYNALEDRILPLDLDNPPFALPMPFLLYCGGADRVKNLETLLQAVSRLQIPLVIAGWIAKDRITELLAGLPPADHRLVTFAGYVADNQLATLYIRAAALVLPSLNEGFGYPPLEAMRCGTPAIVSRAGSLPEILGDAALFVENPLDPGEWSDQIGRLLGSPSLRGELLDRGRALVPKYSRAEFEKKMRQIYFDSD